MKNLELLGIFLKKSYYNARIGPTHISVYVVLLDFWRSNGFQYPLCVYRSQIMELSRISGFSTYHRIMRDLVESGYITYKPGFDRKGNRIEFKLNLQEGEDGGKYLYSQPGRH